MKLIHTADWHLGKLFYGCTLTDEQEWILKNQFLPMIDEERPDAVILAGDVYDRSVPPAEAVALFDDMVAEIVQRRKIPFLVISGNHDSAERLSFASGLLRGEGLYMCGELMKTADPVLLEDQWGTVAFVPLPFAEPAEVRMALQDDTIHDYEGAERALSAALLARIPQNCRRVAVAHAFLSGGAPSDSERPLSIGGSDQIPADIFQPYHYTALGHLHGPQKAGADNIRYSGSLLKYSFGEARQKKGVLAVDLDGQGRTGIRFVPLVPRRDVRIIQGRFADIMAAPDQGSDDFLLIRLEDEEPVIDGMARLRMKYPSVMALEALGRNNADAGTRENIPGKVTEQDLFRTFSQEFRKQDLSEKEEIYMNRLWEDILKEGNL